MTTQRPPRSPHHAQTRRLGRRALRHLSEGTLTLGQIVGLTRAELEAIGEAAQAHRRAGHPGEAIALWGLVAAHDPLEPASWAALPSLLRQVDQRAAADACAAVHSALGDDVPAVPRRAAQPCGEGGAR